MPNEIDESFIWRLAEIGIVNDSSMDYGLLRFAYHPDNYEKLDSLLDDYPNVQIKTITNLVQDEIELVLIL